MEWLIVAGGIVAVALLLTLFCKWLAHATWRELGGTFLDLLFGRRRIERCANCGWERTEFHDCPTCGKTYCIMCFDVERGECLGCAEAAEEDTD